MKKIVSENIKNLLKFKQKYSQKIQKRNSMQTKYLS